tara:strand:- start:97 stop:282 length:186 start_codon:yes stop_codon:yes gene_type:complete
LKNLSVSKNRLICLGGAKGDRTPDLNTASVALSQLSYGPRNPYSKIFSTDSKYVLRLEKIY